MIFHTFLKIYFYFVNMVYSVQTNGKMQFFHLKLNLQCNLQQMNRSQGNYMFDIKENIELAGGERLTDTSLSLKN